MSDPTHKQLSRRDALKLLGAAAGASVLANLPSRWSTPQSVAGVLPAHAKTSGPGAVACLEYALQVDVASDPETLYESSGNWSTADPLRWSCRTECAWFWAWANDSLTNLLLAIKVWEHSAFVKEVQAGLTYWIYVGDNGHYSEGTGTTLVPPEGSKCEEVTIEL